MRFRLILVLVLGLLAFAGFKLGLYSEQMTAPYDMVAWFFGGIFMLIGTFGALGVAYDIVNRSNREH